MSSAHPADRGATLRWLGLIFLAAGLLGHVLAAQAIGGTYIAYRDHLLGFALLVLVFGALLTAIGHRFWRARPEWTILSLGVVQVLFGLAAYVTRFTVHG
jgi:hypothetical protein